MKNETVGIQVKGIDVAARNLHVLVSVHSTNTSRTRERFNIAIIRLMADHTHLCSAARPVMQDAITRTAPLTLPDGPLGTTATYPTAFVASTCQELYL